MYRLWVKLKTWVLKVRVKLKTRPKLVNKPVVVKPSDFSKKPMDHVATLDRVKPGMWVFCVHQGWVRVHRTNAECPILAGEIMYHADGRQYDVYKYPSIFLIDIIEGTSTPEIDWKKVPRGTTVSVANSRDESRQTRLFHSFSPNSDHRFICTVTPADEAEKEAWKWCRLPPGAEIKDEWLK